MATLHQHRASSPGAVSLNFDIPLALLDGDEFEDLRALRTAYDEACAKAEAVREAKADHLGGPDAVLRNRDAAAHQALMNNKRPPAAISESDAETLYAMAARSLTDALRVAKRAGDEYEAALLAARPAIRKALTPVFQCADEEAAEAKRVAAEKDANRSRVLGVFLTLDSALAHADDTAAGGRTHRHRNALSAAHSGEDDTTAVFSDFTESDHYLLARKGEAAVAEVRRLTAEIAAAQNGEGGFAFKTGPERAWAVAKAQDAIRVIRGGRSLVVTRDPRA